METLVDWDAVENDFRLYGFLSDSAQHFRAHFKIVMGDWFSLASDINALGQTMYVECSKCLPGKVLLDPTSVSLQLMVRCLNSFQASLLLAEVGMGLEAQAHVRSIFETAFWMGYVGLQPQKAVLELKSETLASEISLFEASLRHLKGISPEIRAETKSQIKEMRIEFENLPRARRPEEIAKLADFGPRYFHYKDLSNGAIHTSFKSVHSILNKSSEGEVIGHQIGPDEENTGKAIWLACISMILAIVALGRFSECKGYGERLDALNDRFQGLTPYRPKVA